MWYPEMGLTMASPAWLAFVVLVQAGALAGCLTPEPSAATGDAMQGLLNIYQYRNSSLIDIYAWRALAAVDASTSVEGLGSQFLMDVTSVENASFLLVRPTGERAEVTASNLAIDRENGRVTAYLDATFYTSATVVIEYALKDGSIVNTDDAEFASKVVFPWHGSASTRASGNETVVSLVLFEMKSPARGFSYAFNSTEKSREIVSLIDSVNEWQIEAVGSSGEEVVDTDAPTVQKESPPYIRAKLPMEGLSRIDFTFELLLADGTVVSSDWTRIRVEERGAR